MDHLPPRVQFERISKRYPGVQALDAVSFDVVPGCIHAVVGENGAGKSTLMRILGGATPPDAGVIYLDGRPVGIRGARHARELGIAVVYQELNLAADLTVSENVFLGRWPRTPWGWIRYPALHALSRATFRSLGVDLDGRCHVGGLSVAQQQMVEIARALSMEAKVLVLDEPSAVLTPQEIRALFQVIRRLKSEGVSILYISHRMEEIFELADWVTVLRDGRHVSTRPVNQVSRDGVIREMVGRPIEEEYPGRTVVMGEVILRVEGLSAPRRFREVRFEVREGEVFALTGLVGSGRSSVGKALFGAVRGTRGRVHVGGVEGPFRSPGEAQRAGVAFLPEDRKRQGLLPGRSVRENVTLAHLRDVSRLGVLSGSAERAVTRRKIDELQIKAPDAGASVSTLSGGNQQKVLIARWLQRAYRVIILDEPTRGVDVGAKVEVYEQINRMAAGRAGVILISSELLEVIGMADRIGVMRDGRIAGILDNRDRRVTQEAILRLAVGEPSGPPGANGQGKADA